jgi:hypothetical protein
MRKIQHELRHELTNIADQYGARLIGVWHTRRRHLRWTFAKGENLILITSGSNRSDWRAYKNVAAGARRMLRG